LARFDLDIESATSVMKNNGTIEPRKKVAKSTKSVRRAPANHLLHKEEACEPKPQKDSPTVLQTISVHARIDIGYGNRIFIRGQGDGLNWEKGTPMECVSPSDWVWSVETTNRAIVFKLLLNDQVWAQGEDTTATAGESLEVTPRF
jgi:hypothetical protein